MKVVEYFLVRTQWSVLEWHKTITYLVVEVNTDHLFLASLLNIDFTWELVASNQTYLHKMFGVTE